MDGGFGLYKNYTQVYAEVTINPVITRCLMYPLPSIQRHLPLIKSTVYLSTRMLQGLCG